MSDPSLSQIANLDLVRRLMEDGFGKGDVKWLTSAIADEYVGHLGHGDHYGPDGVRIDIAGFRSTLAEFTVIVDDLFAFHDNVVRRFTFRGRISSPRVDASRGDTFVELRGIGIDRFADGKFVESWVMIDPLCGRNDDWTSQPPTL